LVPQKRCSFGGGGEGVGGGKFLPQLLPPLMGSEKIDAADTKIRSEIIITG
jgi:hypothetical protein